MSIVARELVWEERRKPGGVRVIAYAGPRSSTTRFGAAWLFIVATIGLLWIANRFVKDYPPWVNVVLVGFLVAGLAAAFLSSQGSAQGRIEITESKLHFSNRGLFAPTVDVTIANVVSFSADTNAEGRYRVYVFMRNGGRIQLATFATLGAANEMVHELDQLVASLQAMLPTP